MIALVYNLKCLNLPKIVSEYDGLDEHVHLLDLDLNKSQESKSQTASLKMKICHKTKSDT